MPSKKRKAVFRMLTNGEAVQLSGLTDADCISEGTFAGKVIANSSAVSSCGDKQIRNIYAGTSSMTASSTSLATGDIYLQYE